MNKNDKNGKCMDISQILQILIMRYHRMQRRIQYDSHAILK